MALTKTTVASDIVVGFTCVIAAPPPVTPPPPPVTVPAPPPISGLPDQPLPQDQGCADVQVTDYQDSFGYCWRVLHYPCATGFGNTYRSPIPCP